MSHGDKVSKLPKSFSVIASTSNAKFAAIANENKRIYGLQFHPEVIHTLQGEKILEVFPEEKKEIRNILASAHLKRADDL